LTRFRFDPVQKALVKEADATEFREITPDNVAQTIPFLAAAAS
jgi:hypothetical protein